MMSTLKINRDNNRLSWTTIDEALPEFEENVYFAEDGSIDIVKAMMIHTLTNKKPTPSRHRKMKELLGTLDKFDVLQAYRLYKQETM